MPPKKPRKQTKPRRLVQKQEDIEPHFSVDETLPYEEGDRVSPRLGF